MKRAADDLGLLYALGSAAAFASSGPFAKALIATGWTPGAVVLARVGLAGLILLGPALVALDGRWRMLRAELPLLLAYGAVAVALCQVAYFGAVQRMPVGVALLLEYLAVVFVVLWVWVRSRRAPSRPTLVAIVGSVAGLVLVIDPRGSGALDPVGVAWGLTAAVGLTGYFVLASHTATALPAVVLASGGMLVGTVALAAVSATGLLPLRFAAAPVSLAGAPWPWWGAVGELALVAAALAYLLGTLGARRLGSTLASFVGLTEVLFALLLAWLLLGELPRPAQLGGGALLLAGIALVRADELRRGRVRR